MAGIHIWRSNDREGDCWAGADHTDQDRALATIALVTYSYVLDTFGDKLVL